MTLSLIPGAEIPPLSKTVYQRALAEREFVADSVHSDGYTQAKGYPGALVSAYVITGYVAELMIGLFGESWAGEGRYRVKFIGTGLQQGDAIAVHGIVRTVSPLEDGRERVTLDLWIERADGAKAVVGEASGVQPVSGVLSDQMRRPASRAQ